MPRAQGPSSRAAPSHEESDCERALREAVDGLPRGLRAHVLRVVDEAVRLARLHGVDEDRARLAALGHDIFRGHSPDELLALAAMLGVEPDALERESPVLLHGLLASRVLAERYGVRDRQVLDAARWHTTARPEMTALEKVLFLADKVEPGKSGRNRGRQEVRSLADRDLDAAMLRFLEQGLAYALRKGWPLHPATVAARNEVLLSRPR